MFDLDWPRLLGTSIALFLLAWLARWGLGRLHRFRRGRRWDRAATATGLPLAQPAEDAGPRLEGSYQGRSTLVECKMSPEEGLQTRARMGLRVASPVRLTIRRDGPLALLGQLAEARFRREKLETSEAIEVEGDPETIRGLLTGPLKPLLEAFEDWRLEIGPHHVLLVRPGCDPDPELLRERLELLAAAADYLEQRGD